MRTIDWCLNKTRLIGDETVKQLQELQGRTVKGAPEYLEGWRDALTHLRKVLVEEGILPKLPKGRHAKKKVLAEEGVLPKPLNAKKEAL